MTKNAYFTQSKTTLRIKEQANTCFAAHSNKSYVTDRPLREDNKVGYRNSNAVLKKQQGEIVQRSEVFDK